MSEPLPSVAGIGHSFPLEADVLIDCNTCAVRGLACHDCVIGVFLDTPIPPLDLDLDEREAIDSLVAAGLVPPFRLVALPSPESAERGIA